MKGFDPITLQWDGQDYTVPADRQLELIARVEEALRRGSDQSALGELMRPGGCSLSRLARAFGAALRYAGASVGDDEVYLSIEGGLASGSAEYLARVSDHVMMILAIIAPQTYRHLSDYDAEDAEKKPRPAD